MLLLRLLRAFFIALAKERRGNALLQGGHVNGAAGLAGVLAGLREAVFAHAAVGGAEEVEVLAAGVESRLGDFAETVGDLRRWRVLKQGETTLSFYEYE